MSLKRNVISNYASQLYVTAVGIVMVPLYISYMGAEAYGLVGFFAMLQAWFNLLDMGLTPTIARETARFRAGALTSLNYRQLVRALEGIFLGVALFGCLVLLLAAEVIASKWLNATHLPGDEVSLSLRLMAVAIALRWISGLYRGVVSGSERLVWLSGFNAGIATLRFVCILPVLMFWSASPTTFFAFQLGVAVVEFAGLTRTAYSLLPAHPGPRVLWNWEPIKPLLKFSLTIAFTSGVWVLVTQTDKLLLSTILPLAEYGYFTVAVLVAGGIAVIGGPISNAVMPRMALLQAEGKEAELIALYRQATQMVIVAALPVALMLACFPTKVLWAWTGNPDLSQKAAPILTLYAAGYGILAVSAFPYYLQYAKGDLKLHLRGNLFFVILLMPSIVLGATHYGAIGAGWAWLISNAVYFLFWTPLVHRRFAAGLHTGWLLRDILRPLFLPVAAVLTMSQWVAWADSRPMLAAELIIAGGTLLLLCYGMAGRVGIFKGKFGYAKKMR